ncbi:MAG: hypothetical protein ACOCUD_03450 [Bacillota bacterium]
MESEKVVSNTKIYRKSDFQVVLNHTVKFPGVKIDRSKYLNKELSRHCNNDIVKKAIALTPSVAGVEDEIIKKIAESSIKYETTKVTSISAAASISGGIMMAATIPGDLAQYFAHILRILQKLIYLYGWQQIELSEDKLDDATKNQLTLFVGVMFGVTSANVTIAKIAHGTAFRTQKDLMNKALTHSTIYPIVKKVAYKLGVRMNKEIFAKSTTKIIPGIGAVFSGGITYLTYKPLANRLYNYLASLHKVTTTLEIDNNGDCELK